jgi:hypothetical protein
MLAHFGDKRHSLEPRVLPKAQILSAIQMRPIDERWISAPENAGLRSCRQYGQAPNSALHPAVIATVRARGAGPGFRCDHHTGRRRHRLAALRRAPPKFTIYPERYALETVSGIPQGPNASLDAALAEIFLSPDRYGHPQSPIGSDALFHISARIAQPPSRGRLRAIAPATASPRPDGHFVRLVRVAKRRSGRAGARKFPWVHRRRATETGRVIPGVRRTAPQPLQTEMRTEYVD